MEHFIIADDSYWPIMRRRYGMFRPAPVNERAESYFYQDFYDTEDNDYSISVPFKPTEK